MLTRTESSGLRDTRTSSMKVGGAPSFELEPFKVRSIARGTLIFHAFPGPTAVPSGRRSLSCGRRNAHPRNQGFVCVRRYMSVDL